MKLETSKIATLIIATSLSSVAWAANSAANVEADNSKRNAAIQEKGTLTSQDQGNSEADVELTRKIRQAVVARDSFSTNAKNVKIITINGVVTLKGPVKTSAERNEIARMAANLAGETKVVNQISVE